MLVTKIMSLSHGIAIENSGTCVVVLKNKINLEHDKELQEGLSKRSCDHSLIILKCQLVYF